MMKSCIIRKTKKKAKTKTEQNETKKVAIDWSTR